MRSFSKKKSAKDILPGRRLPLKQKSLLGKNQTSISPPINPLVQTKLRIGQPNDKYEQEADRIADQVMRTPDAGKANSRYQIMPLIQRDVETEEDDEAAENENIPEEEEEDKVESLQAKPISSKTPMIGPGLQSQVNSIKGGGKPLSKSERAFFEPRFGADFSQIRIHTSRIAAATAKSINARAFTKGKDIVFGSGQYLPNTKSGKKLLAHELTHVLQQRNLFQIQDRHRMVNSTSNNLGKIHLKTSEMISKQEDKPEVSSKNKFKLKSKSYSLKLKYRADFVYHPLKSTGIFILKDLSITPTKDENLEDGFDMGLELFNWKIKQLFGSSLLSLEGGSEVNLTYAKQKLNIDPELNAALKVKLGNKGGVLSFGVSYIPVFYDEGRMNFDPKNINFGVNYKTNFDLLKLLSK